MLLLPIGHEDMTVRRLPWVSFTIMGLCVVAYILTLLAGSSEVTISQREEAALDFYFEHAYLELDERVKGYRYYTLRQMHGDPPPAPADTEQVATEQEELDRRVALVFEALGDVPYYRWGLVPADIKAYAVISHMFMHAGFLHLFGNLFIFYLVGPFIEDAWGRPLFAVFYLMAGSMAGLLFAFKVPGSDDPLVGASGAIAGVMGAFMIRFWRTKITLFYWMWFYFRIYSGTFQTPAWFLLSLWIIQQVVFAFGGWAYSSLADAGNVAYWAHVYGFVFGVVVAAGVKQFRIEERFVDAAIEKKLTVFDNVDVERAVDAGREGRAGEALQRLRRQLAADAENLDAAAALWNLAVAEEVAPEVLAQVMPVVRHAARDGDVDLVRTYWADIVRTCRPDRVDFAVSVRVAEMLHANGDLGDVADTVEWLVPALSADRPVAQMVRLARVSHALHLPQAAIIVEMVGHHPELTPESVAELQKIAAEAVIAEELPAAISADEQPAPELRVIPAQPQALRSDALQVQAEGKSRVLKLAQLVAVAVAGIEGQPKPYLVIDLLLDAPGGPGAAVRVVRLTSNTFDPRSVVGGDSPIAALRELVAQILDRSGAEPLPDRASATGQPFRRYPSLEEYERAVLV